VGDKKERKVFINNVIALAATLQRYAFSHFNCSIFVKSLTTFFGTMFFGHTFGILSIQAVELMILRGFGRTR
jgi:hypothetical protein